MKKLPDKPSELIRVAMGDLRKIEQDKRYRVRMEEWHSGITEDHGRCTVCLAGSVMAKTLDAPIADDLDPSAFDDSHTMVRLRALDDFRNGLIHQGLLEIDGYCWDGSDLKQKLLGEYATLGIPERKIFPAYDDDRQAFRAAMLDLANELEMFGR